MQPVSGACTSIRRDDSNWSRSGSRSQVRCSLSLASVRTPSDSRWQAASSYLPATCQLDQAVSLGLAAARVNLVSL